MVNFGTVVRAPAVAIAIAGALGGCDFIIGQVGGAWDHNPPPLSDGALDLVKRSFDGIQPGRLRDYHTHMVGMEDFKDGAEPDAQMDPDADPHPKTWVNGDMRSLRSLSLNAIRKYFTGRVYMSAAGVEDEATAGQQYLERLKHLMAGMDDACGRATDGACARHGKYHLFGFDFNFDTDHYKNHGMGADGKVYPRNADCFENKECKPNLEKSTFFVSNAHVVELAKNSSDRFVPVVSVNPYRWNAVDMLRKWASEGVRMVKWLPNSQGIDACDRRLKRYYCTLKAHDMTLITHVGEEKAAEASDDQALGNPLRFRYPLELGVKVIMAHGASLGENDDLDYPWKKASNFDLFMRLMSDPRYEDNLFGEISAMTQFNRVRFDIPSHRSDTGPLLELLRRPDLHHRLVNGSDYPLPAVNFVNHLSKLVKLDMIDDGDADPLREIYSFNPLLFDFVLKRTVRDPDTCTRDSKTGKRNPGTCKHLPAGIFMANGDIGGEGTPDALPGARDLEWADAASKRCQQAPKSEGEERALSACGRGRR